VLSPEAKHRLTLSMPGLSATELTEQARTVAGQSAEVDRLSEQLAAVRSRLAGGEEPGPVVHDLEEQRRALHRRLEAIAALAAPGYTLPRAAGQLVKRARECGWRSRVVWTSVRTGHAGEPFVTLRVSRVLTEVELEEGEYRGDRWYFRLVWHSRDCPAGRLRLFSCLASTPDHPGWAPGPSLKGVSGVMSAHPGPDAAPRCSSSSA